MSTIFFQLAGFFRGPVPHMNGVSGFAEITGHVSAHYPRANN